jgi:hypothetical protein
MGVAPYGWDPPMRAVWPAMVREKTGQGKVRPGCRVCPEGHAADSTSAFRELLPLRGGGSFRVHARAPAAQSTMN